MAFVLFSTCNATLDGGQGTTVPGGEGTWDPEVGTFTAVITSGEESPPAVDMQWIHTCGGYVFSATFTEADFTVEVLEFVDLAWSTLETVSSGVDKVLEWAACNRQLALKVTATSTAVSGTVVVTLERF